MTYKLPEPVAYIHDGGEGRLWWCESVDADGKNKKDDVELFTAGQMQAAYEAGQKSQVRISIPTDAMEQEFQTHYRRGYAAGLAEGRKLTEVWSVTSKVFSVLFATEAQADRFIAATTPAIGATKNRIDVLQPATEPKP